MTGVRWLLLLMFLMAVGCGPDGPERGSVSGTVSLDGKSVKEGSITFIPTDGTTGPTAGGTIADGAFSIPKSLGPLVGKNKVELRAWRLTGRQIPNPMSPGSMMDEKVEAFPPQYNDESTYVIEINSGHNTLDFDLKSAAALP